MIHLLMYADRIHAEGLVSSPYGSGRKADLLDMINLYEKDYSRLKDHANGFPHPDSLRLLCKQGAIPAAPFKGYGSSTEGSEWIIHCARKPSDQRLWILVWGGLEDLAQALHDAPDIKQNIKVYWIGGPNKKWSVNAYAYIAQHHPDLWMIEANATYSGWFLDSGGDADLANDAYYDNHIKGRGALGKAFRNYYEGVIKMGDTPSVAYVMNGDADDPLGDSWGGSFASINYSSRVSFARNTTSADTVATYTVMEWRFKGPELNIPRDSPCFTMTIWDQVWPGYYLGNSVYGIRYAPKKQETGFYVTSSNIPELNGLTGHYVSVNPWPGKPSPDEYPLGSHWYNDRPEAVWKVGDQQGAGTVTKHRSEYLRDWAKRWEWLE